MSNADLDELIETLRAAHEQWLRGTVHPIYNLAAGTVFGPFGGPAVGGPQVREGQAALASQFHHGTANLEVVDSYAEGDLACVIAIEWGTTRFGDDPTERPWTLRTTQIFRWTKDHWTLLHRHADPLIDRRDAESTFALAGGSLRS